MTSKADRAWKWGLVAIMGLVALVHLPPVENYLDNDDAWNYVLEADMLLSGDGSAWVEGGSYLAHQNLQRLIPSLSWIPRYGLFDLWMPAWHLPSILVHALNALLLAVLVTRLGLSREVALLSGLLFGLSPMHPHTVSWIGGTYDLFAGAFLLGTLIAFIGRRTALGLVCLAGACMSKESGVFVGPVLALYVLFFERRAGLRAAVRRLWPYAAVAGTIVGLRLGQIALGGSIDEAGLPARTVGLDAYDLFVKGPVVLITALGAPLRDVLPVGPTIFAALVGGAIIAGLAFRRAVLRMPVLPFCLVSAYLLVVPVLVMREEGRALTAAELLHNARYLYLSLLLLAPLVPLAALGLRPGPTGRTVMLAAVLGSLLVTGRDVLIATWLDSPAETVAETLVADEVAPGAHVYLLANTYDEGAFRVAMSRWLHREKQATYHWVQRGVWRDIHRRPGRTGLDFKDAYVQSSRDPFRPENVRRDRGDEVFLLATRGAAGGHTLTATAVPERPAPGRGEPRPLRLEWREQPAEAKATVRIGQQGAVSFHVAHRHDRPGGYVHRPLVTAPVNLPPAGVASIRLVITATGHGLRPDDRRYSRGYAELHWCSEAQSADATFVQIPLVFDGQQRVVDLPLWFDPVWLMSGDVTCLGFHPLDLAGQVILHGVDVVFSR